MTSGFQLTASLLTPDEMRAVLEGGGLRVIEQIDIERARRCGSLRV